MCGTFKIKTAIEQNYEQIVHTDQLLKHKLMSSRLDSQTEHEGETQIKKPSFRIGHPYMTTAPSLPNCISSPILSAHGELKDMTQTTVKDDELSISGFLGNMPSTKAMLS